MSSGTGTVLCQSTNCLNGKPPSTLACPTCTKLGIKGSMFCNQECFKANCSWSSAYHMTAADGTYNPFPSFRFTGELRPVYPLSPKRQVPAHIPRPEYAETGVPTMEIRKASSPPRILSTEEQEKMRIVCRMGREILDIAASHVRPGVTTDFIDEIVHNATIERNAYPSPLGYREYPKSVCTSVNEVICHGIPDQRELVEGDIINIDVSVYYDGFHADLNETYPVGKVDADSVKLMRTTRRSLDEAIKLCNPGALFRDIGKAIEPVARANQCAVVRQYTGHGVNELFHATPNIPHYAKNKAAGTMKPGMCFTIEPMLNLGTNWDVYHWPDNWTATTVDGKRSAQFEETLLITETGVEVLTAGKPREDLV
ncbi:methionine aminopeptidase [Gloeophyllum trabeum ATCC 11539]|uniref:Methionine aminopeptidase n=1 Tax=Gloeophyllum trabeum (strain ATCC 11539 / FP-39264 / Madison 617) TaxID=670483 RepID=S7RXQ2_GLOTA|nr:methionine aminopeptidase [Gloeophyllum trabeum ATCC 11539]EPQ58149.1 methionine aminopeptidase [Gloeophyllum trabeum ATCC 11539]